MGCLIEFFIDLVVEVLLEVVIHCYLKLMHMIVPTKTVTDKTKAIIKRAVTTIAAILALILFLGVILWLAGQEDTIIKEMGRYMIFIPLILMLLQMILGIVVKLISCFHKCRKGENL